MKPSKQIIDTLLTASGKSRLSIAFCPYKFSMWDCMEPVYRHALETSGIRADIIPLDYITYPHKRRYNERDAFMLANYSALPLEALYGAKYDYIVIHYPYDTHNIVTSLTPECCSEILKQYGTLVYIPYHGNIAGPEWSRFYGTSGARNADFVVLGSDLDRQAYLEKNPGCEFKIIQTDGSTKAECAELHAADPISSRFADLPHPLILIAGTLHTFTRNPHDTIKRHLFRIWEEKNAGHSIIYRPHPLVRDAIAVMVPDALEEYDAFINTVKTICTYDDSPFLHDALRAADKLICDPSSVQRTWQGTGKPMEVMEE